VSERGTFMTSFLYDLHLLPVLKLEEAFFFGIIRDRHECRCHCHNVAVTSNRDGPFCAVTRAALSFDSVYDAPLPDLIFPHYTGPLPENYELWKDPDE
jgi:hypothetical protein